MTRHRLRVTGLVVRNMTKLGTAVRFLFGVSGWMEGLVVEMGMQEGMGFVREDMSLFLDMLPLR